MLSSDFQITRKIGEGQFGHIFLAKDKNQRDVVIKRVEKRHGCKEHEILPSLKHPNIIKVIDVLAQEEATSIVMEYALNGDLASYIKRQYAHEYVPQKVIRSWVLQICLALYYLHYQQNLIHRDVKLINVLVMENGLLKLADFGLTKKVNVEEELGKNSVGTPYYLSPESISFGSFTVKSDVWGLGCLVYEICTGSKPFKGKAFGEIFHNIVEGIAQEFPPEAQYSKWLQNLKNSEKRPSIMSVLDDTEMRKQFDLLKTAHCQFDGVPYPELCVKTTKNYQSEQKFSSGFKLFSESLKTSKKQRVGRSLFLQSREEHSISGTKKVQRFKFADKSLRYFLQRRE